MRIERLTEPIDALRRQMRDLQAMAELVAAAPDCQISLTDPDARAMATHGKGTGLVGYNVQAAVDARDRLDRMPEAVRIRRRTVEHVFGTIKDWMGRSHFTMRRLKNVGTEMSLHVLAYNIKRATPIIGVRQLIHTIQP